MKKFKEYFNYLKVIIKNSYSPYSRFKVAALVITKNNKIYTGVNIENASFSLTICAERVALFKAVSEGEKHFKMLFIYTPTQNFTYPCGACLQVLKEFNKNLKIVLINKKGKTKSLDLKSLFKNFNPPSLKRKN